MKGTPKSRKGQRTQEVVEVAEAGELVRRYDEDVSLVWWRLPALPDAETALRRDPFVWTGEVDAAGTELEMLGPLVESSAVLERARMRVELHTSLFEVDAVGVRTTLTQTPLCPSLHVSRQHCQLLTAFATLRCSLDSSSLGVYDRREAARDDEGQVGPHSIGSSVFDRCPRSYRMSFIRELESALEHGQSPLMGWAGAALG
jgi:hypothetical protein